MASFDFDFPRYIARRKGAKEAEAREGAAYAYTGDVRVLRTLARLRPVTLAVEGAARLWRQSARAELLGTAIRVTERQFPRLDRVTARCAEALHVAAPTVYVSPSLEVPAWTFGAGTGEDAAIVVRAALLDEVSDAELAFVVGRECGHVQNGHVLYRTAYWFLRHSASSFLRWIVTPAVAALEAWRRRGDITADRAGLLCMRDVDLACATIGRLAAPIAPTTPPVAVTSEGDAVRPGGPVIDAVVNGDGDGDDAIADGPPESEGPGAETHSADSTAAGERDRREADARTAAPPPPEVSDEERARVAWTARRQAALRVFGESAYFRGLSGQVGGWPPEACDERVAEIISKGI